MEEDEEEEKAIYRVKRENIVLINGNASYIRYPCVCFH